MGKMKNALVRLAKKVTGKDVKDTNSISNVIDFMADNYTGGGAGTVSGTFNFSGAVISKEVLGYKSAYIDMEALVDQLRKSGVDVDAPNFLNENERGVTINICPYTDISDLLKLMFIRGGEYVWQLEYYTPDAPVSPKTIDIIWEPTDSLKDILLRVENVINQRPFNLPSYGNMLQTVYNNMIALYYGEIGEYQFFNISDVNEFCKKVFIEYNSGSDSSSSN